MILNEDLKKLSIIISKGQIGLDLISNKIPKKKKKKHFKENRKTRDATRHFDFKFFSTFLPPKTFINYY